jgi:hypothetical protein
MGHAQTCPTPDVVTVMTQSSTTSITTRCHHRRDDEIFN